MDCLRWLSDDLFRFLPTCRLAKEFVCKQNVYSDPENRPVLSLHIIYAQPTNLFTRTLGAARERDIGRIDRHHT